MQKHPKEWASDWLKRSTDQGFLKIIHPCIFQTKTLIQKYTCTPMFIATLFTIAKIWKQPKWWGCDELGDWD